MKSERRVMCESSIGYDEREKRDVREQYRL